MKSKFLASAAAAAAVFFSRDASASLTINLQFADGSTSYSLRQSDVGTTIPIQMWATVTGNSPITPGNDGPGGNHDGLQYVYYNMLSSLPLGRGTAVDGQISGESLDYKFGPVGAQAGAYNVDLNGDGVGDVGSTSVMNQMAKPRSPYPVWDDYFAGASLVGSPGVKYGADGRSVSFLVETFNFTVDSLAGQETSFNPNLPTLGVGYAPANWFQDDPIEPGTFVSPGPQYTYTAPEIPGTSVLILAPNAPVPEPTSLSVLALAGVGLLVGGRKPFHQPPAHATIPE